MEQTTIQEILKKVLSTITPVDDEREKLKQLSDKLLERVNSHSKEHGIQGILVGSAARDTWITGEHDIDIFILFPESATRETLETTGLDIARRVLFDADKTEERYAEHPYLNGIISDYKIDIVPCFNIKNLKNIKSAVDRTPHHNNFVKEHIKGREGDVRLTKQFLKTAGIYGSELRTHGFSGYLTELLIIHYGSFPGLLTAASNWEPRTLIDIKNHSTLQHTAPLTVIDPTDPKRNVAAALSQDNMCTFIDAARSFLQKPDITYFFKTAQKQPEKVEIEKILSQRGTELAGVSFNRPDIVDDALYPQLEKMRQSTEKLLKYNDFRVINSSYTVTKDNIYVVFELFESRIPKIKKHIGPPVWVKTNAEKFKEKYQKNPGNLSHLYIEDGRYVIDIQRPHTTPSSLLTAELLNCGLGKHLTQNIKEKGFHTLQQGEILEIKTRGFMSFLYRFLTRQKNLLNP